MNANDPNRKPNEPNKSFNLGKKPVGYSFAASQEEIIVYTLLGIALITLLFFNGLLGGLIIGGIAGYYFAEKMIYFLRNVSQTFVGKDQLRYVILSVLGIALFISAPGIFIGALIAAAFKQMFTNKIN